MINRTSTIEHNVPTGVESKNETGALKTRAKTVLWKLVAAVSAAALNVSKLQ